MQNNEIANYIIYDLSKKIYVPTDLRVNTRVISRVVDDWNEKIYVVPNEAVKLHQNQHKKYVLM